MTFAPRLGARIALGANRLSPAAANIPKGKSDDPRMGVLFTDSFDEATVVLIGFPHDEGCTRNGGRPGAKLGPSAFRRFVSVLGACGNSERDIDLVASRVRVFDLGDVVATCPPSPEADLEASHALLEDAVAFVLSEGKIPFVVGGGNDQSAPNGRGALRYLASVSADCNGDDASKRRRRTLGVINIDAHLDVRPKIDGKVHSGTPFRELLEDPRLRSHDESPTTCQFIEFACQGQQCSKEHVAFVKENHGKLFWLTQLKPRAVASFLEAMATLEASDRFVSFDIDAVTSADCPGVSCPGSVGLSAQDAFDIAFAAGSDPSVPLMDLSELNPAVEDYRSPRLAALIFYHFLLGVAARKPT